MWGTSQCGVSAGRVAYRPWRRVFSAHDLCLSVGNRPKPSFTFLHDNDLHDPHDLPTALPSMDADLIKLVNKLQDTFANLGRFHMLSVPLAFAHAPTGGELDMPQLAVVRTTLTSTISAVLRGILGGEPVCGEVQCSRDVRNFLFYHTHTAIHLGAGSSAGISFLVARGLSHGDLSSSNLSTRRLRRTQHKRILNGDSSCTLTNASPTLTRSAGRLNRRRSALLARTRE